MRYLRMLSNSVAAACLATGYVLALFLHLNPTLPLEPSYIAALLTTVGLFYVAHLVAIFYVLLVMRQVLARELFSPAWISVSELSWMCALAAAAGATLLWRNLTTFEKVVDPATATGVLRSVIVLAVTAVWCLVLARLRRRAPEWRVGLAALLAVIAVVSVAGPVLLRGRGAAPLLDARPIDSLFEAEAVERSAHVAVIAVDAASLDFITRATAEARLPNFGRMLDAGAVRHLATLHPTSAEAVWAAVATGKLPQKNGVRSAGVYDLYGGGSLQLLPDYCFAHGLERYGIVVGRPHTSATLRTRSLWSILSSAGLSVAVVAWPLTQPAPVVRGYLVSDTFHRVALTSSATSGPSTVYPPELQQTALSAMTDVVATPSGAATAGEGDAIDPRDESSARTDRIYDRVHQALASKRPTQVSLTRFQSLDPVGHYFLRYAIPVEFGDVTDDERRRFGSIVERHYALIDEAIGRAMTALGPNDLLLVVSGYGMEPLNVGKRLIERLIGDPDISGTHEMAPDGFLMAYGAAVARGRQGARASVVDVVPTILYYLGLPIGRDMDGFARTDLFQRSFTDDRPIAHIPSYDR